MDPSGYQSASAIEQGDGRTEAGPGASSGKTRTGRGGAQKASKPERNRALKVIHRLVHSTNRNRAGRLWNRGYKVEWVMRPLDIVCSAENTKEKAAKGEKDRGEAVDSFLEPPWG